MSLFVPKSVIILTVLFLLSVVYAWLLQSAWAKPWLQEKVWISVVIGVGYTIGFIALLLPEHGLTVLLAFVVSGLPIVGRSIWNEMTRYQEQVQREVGRGQSAG